MEALPTALVWLAAGLLAAAGASKLRTPDAAMATLHRLHLPSGRIAARAVGLGELAVAAAVVLVGGIPAAAAIAVGYAALLVVAWRMRAAQVDCGCFGVAAAPVSRLHLAVNAAAAAAGLAGLAWAPLPLAEVAADAGGLGTAAGLLLLATGTGLVRVVAAEAAEGLRRTPPAPRAAGRAAAVTGGTGR